MAAPKPSNGIEKRRNRKNKSRTVVDLSSSSSSSSESSTESETESDVSEKKSGKMNGVVTKETSTPKNPKLKPKNKKKPQSQDPDTDMPDVDQPSPANSTSTTEPRATSSAPSKATKPKSTPLSTRAVEEEYSALYLRKVTAELGDDLIKVREAQDFKSSSLAMLRHALRQGESMYDVDEKRRVVGAAAGQTV